MTAVAKATVVDVKPVRGRDVRRRAGKSDAVQGMDSGDVRVWPCRTEDHNTQVIGNDEAKRGDRRDSSVRFSENHMCTNMCSVLYTES